MIFNDREKRMVEDEYSLKGHSEGSIPSLQRQMGTNPLQRKRPDTKITVFFSSSSELGFPSGFELVIILFLQGN